MKTINFCGDSYCATDNKLDSWPVLLARLLNYKAMGFGKDGSSYEHAIQTFDEAADATVFCWTEPHRLYHPTEQINTAAAEQYKDKKLYAAALDYYKYLHINWHMIDRANRDKYWFDNVKLKYYKGKILHLFCFESARYPFKNGIICSRTPLKSMAVPEGKGGMGYANHLSREHNIKLAEALYKLLT